MHYDLSVCENLIPSLSDELKDARRKVAGLLLSFGNSSEQSQHLSQNEMAKMLSVPWNLVHSSLVSLGQENAIKIDRHRLAVNKPLLERIVIMKECPMRKTRQL